ncbi:MAG: hypothetical protein ACR2RV_12525, partial [Verrucomicrobiales bacterium]
ELPPKAQAVSLKFELYQQTADAAAVEAKRRQVIEYLDKLLKNEAAAANLDGARAIKALMERLEKEAPATTTTTSTSASVVEGEGLTLEAFSINHEARRRLEFPFTVARDSAAKSLRCEVAGASDDSGDHGLEYELVDPRGNVVKKGFLSSSESERVVHKTRIGGPWKFVLIDADTELSGEYPGNNGSLRITVARGQAALATNRRAR